MKDMLYELPANAISDTSYAVQFSLFSIDEHVQLDKKAVDFIWNTCFVHLPRGDTDFLHTLSPLSRNLL